MKRNNIFITGYAKLPGGITATELYTVIGIGLVISRKTGVVNGADCTLATETGRSFVKDLIIGKNINDYEKLTEDIRDNYFGSAKKALLSALKQCHDKYSQFIEGKNIVE